MLPATSRRLWCKDGGQGVAGRSQVRVEAGRYGLHQDVAYDRGFTWTNHDGDIGGIRGKLVQERIGRATSDQM